MMSCHMSGAFFWLLGMRGSRREVEQETGYHTFRAHSSASWPLAQPAYLHQSDRGVWRLCWVCMASPAFMLLSCDASCDCAVCCCWAPLLYPLPSSLFLRPSYCPRKHGTVPWLTTNATIAEPQAHMHVQLLQTATMPRSGRWQMQILLSASAVRTCRTSGLTREEFHSWQHIHKARRRLPGTGLAGPADIAALSGTPLGALK